MRDSLLHFPFSEKISNDNLTEKHGARALETPELHPSYASVVVHGKVGGKKEYGLGIQRVDNLEQGNQAKGDAFAFKYKGVRDEDEDIGGVKSDPTKEAKLRSFPNSARVFSTIFIDNIPDQIDNTWICNAFKLSGLVARGFVKFLDPQISSTSINKYVGVWWFDKIIRVSKVWPDQSRMENQIHSRSNKI
ncbi:hypothetical protein U1Q18_009524 [Sarracenia purpurea var. burkii]